MSEMTENEPTPEAADARIHQEWLERRVQTFHAIAETIVLQARAAQTAHDTALYQDNNVRILNALDELLLPAPDRRSPFERFMSELGPSLPAIIEKLAGLGTNPPIVEPRASYDTLDSLTDEELKADLDEVLNELEALEAEVKRRGAPRTIVTDPPSEDPDRSR